MKKTLAILLSLALVICMIPATASVAFADGEIQLTEANVVKYQGYSDDGVTYTGAVQIPEISFYYKANEQSAEVRLVQGVDYTISWGAEEVKNASTYNATITGIGNYKGTISNIASYKINKLNLSNITCYVPPLTDVDTAETVVSKTKFGDISGSALTGDVKATLGSESDGQISVSFEKTESSNNVEGTQSKNTPYSKGFKKIELSPNLFEYTGESLKPTGYTVTDKNDAEVDKTAFKVEYADNVNVGTATIKATAVSGSGYTGFVQTTFRIDPIPASDAISKGILKVADITAKQIKDTTPKVTITQKINGSWVTVPETCYTVTPSNNSVAGTGIATITFNNKSNYTNEGTAITKTFTVVDSTNDISTKITNDKVTVSSNVVTYNGAVQKPTVSVNVSSTIVKQGTDYVIKYEDAAGVRTEKPTAAGTYKVVIEGIGSYAGEVVTTSKW